jgi:hypothetical protein
MDLEHHDWQLTDDESEYGEIWYRCQNCGYKVCQHYGKPLPEFQITIIDGHGKAAFYHCHQIVLAQVMKS